MTFKLELKVTFEDGNFILTGFNGTLAEAEAYYLNKVFNMGAVKDDMQKAVKVEEV